MPFIGPLEDRIAIQDLNASYGDTVIRHDVADFTALWAPDAVWAHPEVGEAIGLPAIEAMITAAFAAFPMVLLRSTIGQLEVDGSFAQAVVYVDEVVATDQGETYRSNGRYDDAYVRLGGRWLYQRRDYRLLHKD